jgi:hypothetical protein
MAAVYRGSSASNYIWAGILVGGFGLSGIALWLTAPYERILGGWILAIVIGAFAVVLIPLLILDARLGRARVRGIQTMLEQFGLVVEVTPSAEILDHLRPTLVDVSNSLGLKGGIDGASWLAYREDILVFEHKYITGSSRHMREVLSTVLAFPANAADPSGASLGVSESLYLERVSGPQARALRKAYGNALTTGDEVFDKLWYICGNEGSAKRFLIPQVRERLLQSPIGEVWVFGSGWVVASYGLPMAESGLRSYMDHVYATLRAVS